MPRKAVIARVAKESKISKTDAEQLVRSVLEAVAVEIGKRGRFHIAEIGSVSVATRPPRRYFNPRTRKESISQGDQVLKINISKQMRERLDSGD